MSGQPAMKRLLRSRLATKIVGAGVAFFIWFVFRTGRWQRIGDELPHAMLAQGKTFIIAVWHGRIGMMPCCAPDVSSGRVLISHHRDGEIIAQAIRWFGLEPIRGSAGASSKAKDKGGADATRRMMAALEDGKNVLITPDGPRGPRMRASAGIIRLAQMSGVPIFPASYSVRDRRVARSWDRFIVPRPFSHGVFLWGQPMEVPRDADGDGIERARLALERTLNDVTRRADELVGQPAIEPEPLPRATRSA